MKFKRILFVLLSLGAFVFYKTPNLHASAPKKPVVEEAPKPDPSSYDFYENITSIEDLDTEVAVNNSDKKDLNVVYRTPESCREFAVFMQEKQKKLTQIESQIRMKEETLKKLKNEFDEATEKFSKLEKRIQKIVKKDPTDIKDNPNFEKMVKLFELLTPEESAERMKNLDLDLTIAILKHMSPKRLTQVMASLDAPLSAALSSRIIRGF